ncbi:hypothetical protein BDN72DRAFT_850791, partial [Pluteus cervinus]
MLGDIQPFPGVPLHIHKLHQMPISFVFLLFAVFSLCPKLDNQGGIENTLPLFNPSITYDGDLTSIQATLFHHFQPVNLDQLEPQPISILSGTKGWKAEQTAGAT